MGERSRWLGPALAVALLSAPGSTTRAQLLEGAPHWIEPRGLYGQFGLSLAAAGDVNGDGFGDVIVGGPFYFTPCCPSVNQQGAVLVYYGTPAGLSPLVGWSEIGAHPGTTLGYRVAGAGDVDDDGWDDVVFASGSGFGNGTHALHVRFGSPTGPSGGWTYDTGLLLPALGPSVAGGGDVDGDGIADVVAGFPHLDGGRGRVVAFHGSAAGLAAFPDWTISGAPGERIGEALAAAGDVDGDGHDDLLVCVRPSSGSQLVRLYRGSPTGLAATPSRSWPVAGLECLSGRPLAGVGDLDRDGIDDLAIGAAQRAHAGGRGAVLIFLGSSDGPGAAPEQTLLGPGSFGHAVDGAGDVNADGFADLLVGAPDVDPSGGPGALYLFLGVPGGVHPRPMWTHDAVDGSFDLGWSAAAAGDVNGDGRPDVLAGDPNAPEYFAGRALGFLNAAPLVPGPAGAVAAPGHAGLSLGRGNAGEVVLSWGPSCGGAAEDFTVHEGVLGDFASHRPASPCGIGGATSWTVPAEGPDRYYLVVPRSLDREGSYGLDGQGLERPPSAEACLVQEVAACR